MDDYTIRGWKSIHTEGTKFYAVYAISSSTSNKAFVVTHWGRLDSGMVPKPRQTGQCKIKEVKSFEVDWEADRAASAKKNRGYSFGAPHEDRHMRPDRFQQNLLELLKGDDARRIFNTICNGEASIDEPVENRLVGEDDGPIEDDTHSRKATPKPPPEKHEDWGSW